MRNIDVFSSMCGDESRSSWMNHSPLTVDEVSMTTPGGCRL